MLVWDVNKAMWQNALSIVKNALSNTWVSMQHTCVFGHMTKILKIKAYHMSISTQFIIELNTMQGTEKPPETNTYKAL